MTNEKKHKLAKANQSDKDKMKTKKQQRKRIYTSNSSQESIFQENKRINDRSGSSITNYFDMLSVPENSPADDHPLDATPQNVSTPDVFPPTPVQTRIKTIALEGRI